MPLGATDISNLEALRSNLIQLLKDESASQAANGAKPSYSIDGESVQWEEWRDRTLARIDSITATITKMSSPFIVRSRGRA